MSRRLLRRRVVLLGSGAALALALAACSKHEQVPSLRIEVTFLGEVDMGRLSRVAEVGYTSRLKRGFIVRQHETRTVRYPVIVEGARLLLDVPKYHDDAEFNLTSVRVPFETDLDRRLGTAVSALNFYPDPATWVPPRWPENIADDKLHSLGFYYEYTDDGLFRTRRYFLGEYADLSGPDSTSFYYSTLENTRAVEVYLDFRPLPYFEVLRSVPDEELATEPVPAPSNAYQLMEALRFDVADFGVLKDAKIRVAAVDPAVKLPFWDGQNLYAFGADWSIMRAADFDALQGASVHHRAQLVLSGQTWTRTPNNLRLPDAGYGQVAWRYLEAPQSTSFVVGVEYQGLVFVRRAP